MSFVRGLFCLKSTVTNPIHGNATMSIYSGSTDSEKRFGKNIYDFSMEKAGKSSKFSHIGDGMNILALQYPDSGKLSTDVPDVDTGIDWLVYLARYSQQCQAQSHFVVRSRLDIVENTEIMVGPNQSFYCGTLRPDCRPFRTGIFTGRGF